MWCPEGCITLTEIDSQLLWDSDLLEPATNKEGQASNKETEPLKVTQVDIIAYIKWMHAALFEVAGEKLRVCLPSGALVRVVPQFFSWFMHADQKIWLGVSAGFPKSVDERLLWSKIKFEGIDDEAGTVRMDLPHDLRIATPLRGCPLCIRETDLPVSLEELPLWLWKEAPRRSNLSRTAATRDRENGLPQRIVDAFKTGKVKTKPEAHRKFGVGMKHEEWRAHWRAATEIDDTLSRPGPRLIRK